MAISACMNCLKSCGYLCGLLAALNIWFWIGMTVFNAMDNPWIKKELLLAPEYTSDTSRFTTVFGVCIALNVLCMIGCCFCTKAGCYQDKDAIEYYVGGGARVSQDFSAMRNTVNGSDPNPRAFMKEGEVNKMEREERELLAGPKTGQIM